MKFEKLLKKNRRLLTILLMLVLIMAGCDSFFNDRKEEYYDPRDHPLIEKGDTLIFKGTENIDTFYVHESQFYKSRERNYDEDYEQYQGRMVHGTYIDTSIVLNISIYNKGYYTKYYYPFRNVEWDPVLTLGSIPNANGNYSMKIGNNEIVDLHEVDFIDEEHDLFREVDTAYYSKTYGFVKLIKYTGEEFVLSEESLEMLMARE